MNEYEALFCPFTFDQALVMGLCVMASCWAIGFSALAFRVLLDWIRAKSDGSPQ